ncbi:MAG: glycosyltransferase [Nitrososphaerota archaeon]
MMLKQPSSPVNHVTYSEEDFNIIIPTRAERPKFITYNNLGPLKDRVIMVYDRWHNVCKALNYGASISKANILFFTDDDAIIPPEKILDIVKLVKKDTAVVFERQDPFGLAITKDDFIKLGGFDERFLCPRMPAYAFDTEFEKRLESKKFRIIKYPLSGVIHYGGEDPRFLSKVLLLNGI